MRRFYLTAAVAIALVAGTAGAADKPPVRQGDAYPLDTCPVSGKKLGSMGDPVVRLYKGREVRFCCKGCVGPFEQKTAEYLKKIDAAIAKQQTIVYPLDTCVVSGRKLGSMGKPVDHVYGNRLVRLCCAGCVAPLEKNAKKYLATLDKAVIAKQKASYPLGVCVVSGKKLGSMGEPVDLVFANRLVRLCCKGCVKPFQKDPARFLKKVRLTIWTCAMHPQVKTAAPGKCPLCAMTLVPQRPGDGAKEKHKKN